ncbi:Uncharacterised protein [Streptococcus pyogenes]|nr:Uncharacterised protein [Streptococcus pyogenes]VGU39576.1 Uncharacterised protein [Streptococcus pyogenes]VHE89446.1 Uncharacterised protein [Streptococcus pyogenes]VHG14501.1 Uncharacterised protein [Streptococcus pyogenes]VHJ31267.1 Uncharacterised protein [Streptococcus pyogenes]
MITSSALTLLVTPMAKSASSKINVFFIFPSPFAHFLRQDGRETLREAKYAAELQIRNLLSQYHINGKEYNNYFRYYYRQAMQARNIDEVNKIIEVLEKNLQAQ